MSTRSFLSVVLAALLMFMGQAHAALLTIDGDDVSFTYDPSSFVIGPGISGDNAAFSSNTITATAGGSSPTGVLATSSTVSFIIQLTNPNDSFSAVALSEHGVYSLSGPDSSVSMAGSYMTISAVGSSASVNSAITPTSSITQNDGQTHGWVASSQQNLTQGPLVGTREIEVTLYNLLTATASPGSSAMIAAGFAGAGGDSDTLSVGVSSVPLPSSMALFGGGLLALLALWGVQRFTDRGVTRFEFATL